MAKKMDLINSQRLRKRIEKLQHEGQNAEDMKGGGGTFSDVAIKPDKSFGVSVMNRLRALERRINEQRAEITELWATLNKNVTTFGKEIEELREAMQRQPDGKLRAKAEDKDKPKVGEFVRVHPIYSWVCPGCGHVNETSPGDVEEYHGIVRCDDCGIAFKAEL